MNRNAQYIPLIVCRRGSQPTRFMGSVRHTPRSIVTVMQASPFRYSCWEYALDTALFSDNIFNRVSSGKIKIEGKK